MRSVGAASTYRCLVSETLPIRFVSCSDMKPRFKTRFKSTYKNHAIYQINYFRTIFVLLASLHKQCSIAEPFGRRV
jgi:hypothetical protein